MEFGQSRVKSVSKASVAGAHGLKDASSGLGYRWARTGLAYRCVAKSRSVQPVSQKQKELTISFKQYCPSDTSHAQGQRIPGLRTDAESACYRMHGRDCLLKSNVGCFCCQKSFHVLREEGIPRLLAIVVLGLFRLYSCLDVMRTLVKVDNGEHHGELHSTGASEGYRQR